MQVTARELWLLNFYRNSELQGALLMGKLARSPRATAYLVPMTEHCATEARHAALLSHAIAEVGGELDPRVAPVQEHYSVAGGIPKELVDLLVLSETLEHRVLDTYRAHLERADVHPVVRRTLAGILEEMEHEHGGEHAGWIEEALKGLPAATVEAAERKWRAVDAEVASTLAQTLHARFPSS